MKMSIPTIMEDNMEIAQKSGKKPVYHMNSHPTLGNLYKSNEIIRIICTHMSIAAHFIIAKTWNQQTND